MKPICTTLSYSGGVQSHALLEMVLRGHIPKPDGFIVINADPGMEDERSYLFVRAAKVRCEAAGIPFITAKGPDLFKDLTETNGTRKRIDNPPYWTKNRETGKIGRLDQCCTREYKIRPMKRALRQHLLSAHGIPVRSSRVPAVETWIGFAADEASRVKPSKEAAFITMKYPLIELGMDRPKVDAYYQEHRIAKPPRSVCVACFANGLAHFEDMYLNRPDDWDKAVAVDDSIRDMTRFGVKDEVFVSATCIPLRDLPALDFLRGTPQGRELRCNSGKCFL